MAKNSRRLVGEIPVDSGQLLIVDPVNLDNNWKNGESYEEACKASGSDARGGEVLESSTSPGVRFAYAFNTSHGNGRYRLYEVRDAKGQLARMEIEVNPNFLMPEWPEVEEEYTAPEIE